MSASISEAAVFRCFSKQAFLKVTQYSQENTCVGVSFQQSFTLSGLQRYGKGIPTKLFSFEYCKVLKNSFFYKKLTVAAPVLNQCLSGFLLLTLIKCLFAGEDISRIRATAIVVLLLFQQTNTCSKQRRKLLK